jgi:hypothetical protein
MQVAWVVRVSRDDKAVGSTLAATGFLKLNPTALNGRFPARNLILENRWFAAGRGRMMLRYGED